MNDVQKQTNEKTNGVTQTIIDGQVITAQMEYTTLETGQTIYTILRHVSQSGMSRSISTVIVDKDGVSIHDITQEVAKVLGYKLSKKDYGMKVGGCGMDMGFHIVYSLGQALFEDGYKLEHRWL